MHQLDLLSWRPGAVAQTPQSAASVEELRQPRAKVQRTTQSIREIERQDARARKLESYVEPPRVYWRPKKRADCANVPRPCPYVGCRYNMALEVTHHGSLRYTHVDADGTLDMVPNCALDYADRGPMTLEAIAATMKLTRERVRQEEAATMQRARAKNVFVPVDAPAILEEPDEEDAPQEWMS